MADAMGVRFQVKGVVTGRDTYTKEGQTKYSLRIAYLGGELEIYGEKAEGLFPSCPAVGEEVLCGGRLQAAGVNRFGRAVFSLEVEAIQAASSRRAA